MAGNNVDVVFTRAGGAQDIREIGAAADANGLPQRLAQCGGDVVVDPAEHITRRGRVDRALALLNPMTRRCMPIRD